MSYKNYRYPLPKFIVAVLCLVSSPLAADNLYTRNLGCQEQTSGRAKVICHALAEALEWRWTGHAIISPGFRISFDGLRHVYCSLPITYRDTELLVDMAFHAESRSGTKQAQINHGVVALLLMLGHQALKHFPDLDKIPDKSRHSHAEYLKTQISHSIKETSTSIFNPQHRYYILRGGCR